MLSEKVCRKCKHYEPAKVLLKKNHWWCWRKGKSPERATLTGVAATVATTCPYYLEHLVATQKTETREKKTS